MPGPPPTAGLAARTPRGRTDAGDHRGASSSMRSSSTRSRSSRRRTAIPWCTTATADVRHRLAAPPAR
eukprot:7751008-Lingulodinium_polyedra.AAC.1